MRAVALTQADVVFRARATPARALRFSASAHSARGAALAKTLGISRSEAPRILDHARQYLRQKFLEAGCTFEPRDESMRSPSDAGPSSSERQDRITS